MKKQSIKKGTHGLNDTLYAAHVGHILTSLTGNANFPAPLPALPGVSTKLDKFNLIVKQIQSGDKTKNLVRNRDQQRASIEMDVDRLFNYVNNVATDITILTTSGFPLAKIPEPVGDMPKCEGFVLIMSQATGECTLKTNTVKGAKSYWFQYTEAVTPETDNWVNIACTESRCKITGLTPGVRYTFRVCAVGAKGRGAWSDYITRHIG